MEVDIACVGFGPATGGFLTTLTQAWSANPADPAFESKAAPGMPLQILCYERADDLAAGVSGVVTQARGIGASFPALNPAEIPMAANVTSERVLYLLDPIGASRRSTLLRIGDFFLRLGRGLFVKDHAFQLPWTPAFLNKHGGLVLSIGQFNQWVASQIMSSGLVQIWPGTPVAAPLFSGKAVTGVRLADQGVDKTGTPTDGFMPGMDIRAQLTVVGDGPVGAIGKALNQNENGPKDRDWAVGMKFVIELPEDSSFDALIPGTVWHTFGYPEPEIFGFLYVHPNRLVSVGIFIPSWLADPSRTAYRYLQHYIQHPALWKVLKDGTLRSWGAKSLEESGRRAEPVLTGDGYARIGEGSGRPTCLPAPASTKPGPPAPNSAKRCWSCSAQENRSRRKISPPTYEKRRRASWVERGAREAENARNGFHDGIVKGLMGVALAGLTHGRLSLKAPSAPSISRTFRPSAQSSRAGDPGLRNGWETTLDQAAILAAAEARPLHDALLTVRGWPEIPFDGRLLVTQQDALLIGGKVQAMPGFADHVTFRDRDLCATCAEKTCVAMCSGQAITEGPDGQPTFEREKCIHCGACLWNCGNAPEGESSNIEFTAGSGGLHSAEN